MKIQIRRNVFETNSSSTHSLTVCEDDVYQRLLNKEAFVDSGGNIYEKQEVADLIKKYKVHEMSLDEALKELCIYTLEDFLESEDNYSVEGYEDTYTTKSGEVIHIFGVYGRDD